MRANEGVLVVWGEANLGVLGVNMQVPPDMVSVKAGLSVANQILVAKVARMKRASTTSKQCVLQLHVGLVVMSGAGSFCTTFLLSPARK